MYQVKPYEGIPKLLEEMKKNDDVWIATGQEIAAYYAGQK